MSAPSSIRSRRPARKRSSVLILTLITLTSIVILLIAFVALVTKDRGASQNYVQSIKAEQIGLGGLDQVVAQLQAEITDSTRSTANGAAPYSIYVPQQNAYAVPQRMSGLPASLPTLVKISTNEAFFTPTAGTANAGLASPSLSSAFSVNGRSVGLNRWNKPALLTTTTGFPVPNWVLVTRSGPQVETAYTSTLSDPSTGNGGYVLGRYAYAIYDTSGLIDVNVAGNPSSSSTTNCGFLPFADLTQLTNAVTSADVNSLVQWRNTANYSSYNAYVTSQWITNGFTRVANGDNTFLGRQDLINYAQQENNDLTNALPYLTTFSREFNGPTWGPAQNLGTGINGTNYNYQQNATASSTVNPLVFNARVQTAFTRNNGTAAVVGEPLMKYRFPLDKLALFNIPYASLTAQNLDDIARYFGLDPVTTDASGTYHHWVYPTASTKYSHTGGAGIMTLNQIASLPSGKGREPDFFELLQAGILQGSLGEQPITTTATWKSVRTDYVSTLPTVGDPDQNVTYHLLRIGANIIDQWKSDDYPTTIQTTQAGAAVNLYGVEDLPYLNQVLAKVYDGGSTATPGPWDYCLYFEMWNPHQPSTSTASPANFRIVPYAGTSDTWTFRIRDNTDLGYWIWNQSTGAWDPGGTSPGQNPLVPTPLDSSSTPTNIITFAASYGTGTTTPPNFREPAVISTGTINGGATPSSYGLWTPSSPVTAVFLAQIPQPNPNLISYVGTSGETILTWGNRVNWEVYLGLNLTVLVQYFDGSNWRTYATLTGFENDLNFFTAGNHLGTLGFQNATLNTYALLKVDPRTSRFGPSIVDNGPGTYNNIGALPAAGANSADKFRSGDPDPFINDPGPAVNKPYRTDLWSINDPTVLSTSFKGPDYTISPYNLPYYKDPDGVTRGGDAKYSYVNSNSPLFASPTTGVNAARPIMLHRAFTSVGELGYAFRDDPWRTLDLFTPDSPDAGLLDLFTLSDAPIQAGRVNPNTPYGNVIAALLAGAPQDAKTTGVSLLPASAALNIGNAMTNASTATPFLNRSQLATSLMTNSAVTAALPTGIKAQREAVVRALAESANTRTWNLLIDLVAQSGNYPTRQNNLTLDNFSVTGERRYWLHIAIDRYTGQVVDKELEVVNE